MIRKKKPRARIHKKKRITRASADARTQAQAQAQALRAFVQAWAPGLSKSEVRALVSEGRKRARGSEWFARVVLASVRAR